MELLRVDDLRKEYEHFTLDNVSFALERGYIMGFIGRNGAGKTTTLKAIMNLIHRDGGNVSMFGRDFTENEFYCKQRVGFMLGGFDFYPKRRLRDIADVTRRFYADWDETAYRRYLTRFELIDDKRADQLSAGMAVKFSLALALSHHAELLLLDEPTSGLDPVSRDDLIELFQEIIEDGEHSILFSTHITSDLEKCADYITYIKNGRVLRSCTKDDFTGEYRLVRGKAADLVPPLSEKLVGVKQHAFGFDGLIRAADLAAAGGLEIAPADLETIMIHCDREAET